MIRCNELWLLFTLLTSLLLGMQADKIDTYEYDGKTVVPKNVTGCQDRQTGIILKSIKISKKSQEIALLPHGIKTDIGLLELWIEFANRCNGKSQCQMNQMEFLNSVANKVPLSSETNTTIEINFNCKPIGGDNVYRIDRNFNKVGSTSVYLLYNETSENKVVCHVTANGTTKIEILHFEWIPTSDCLNSNDNISLSSQEFNCSWTKANKAVTVPNPDNFPIQFLKQTGFVWLEVQRNVGLRNRKLQLTCVLEPLKEKDSKNSLTPSSVASTTITSVFSSQTSPIGSTSTTQTSSKLYTESTQTSSNTMNTTARKTVDTAKNSGTITTPPKTTFTSTDTLKIEFETTTSTPLPSSTINISQASAGKDTPILIHIAIGVGVTAFLVLILVIALCVIYLRQSKSEELSINPKRTSIDGVLTMKEDYATSLYTQVGINQGSAPKETDQLPMSAVAASLPSTCKSNTETQSPDVEYAAVNKSKKGSNPMVDPSNKDMNQFPNAEYATVNKVSTILTAMPEKSSLKETQFPNAEYATVNKVSTILSAMPEKSSLKETQFPNTEYASVNKVNKSSNLVLEPSNANESNFSYQESAVENKVTKSPHPKPAHKKSSTLPSYINVKTPNTETPESLYSHLSHMKSADARETENIYNG